MSGSSLIGGRSFTPMTFLLQQPSHDTSKSSAETSPFTGTIWLGVILSNRIARRKKTWLASCVKLSMKKIANRDCINELATFGIAIEIAATQSCDQTDRP